MTSNIPSLRELCCRTVFDNLDDPTLCQLINCPDAVKGTFYERRLRKETEKIFTSDERVQYFRGKITQRLVLNFWDEKMTDQQLERLNGFPIERLALASCPNLTRHALLILKKLPNLIRLGLDGNDWVDDEALGMIPEKVAELSLSSCHLFSGEGLAKLVHLKSLNLFNCVQLKKRDFKQLPQGLRRLDLRSNTLDADGIAALPQKIEVLDLWGCVFGKGAIAPLKKMESLRVLNLATTKVTDADISSIPQGVEWLNLSYCKKITDLGAIALSNRKKLKFVALYRCRHITREAIEKLGDKIKNGPCKPSTKLPDW